MDITVIVNGEIIEVSAEHDPGEDIIAVEGVVAINGDKWHNLREDASNALQHLIQEGMQEELFAEYKRIGAEEKAEYEIERRGWYARRDYENFKVGQ